MYISPAITSTSSSLRCVAVDTAEPIAGSRRGGRPRSSSRRRGWEHDQSAAGIQGRSRAVSAAFLSRQGEQLNVIYLTPLLSCCALSTSSLPTTTPLGTSDGTPADVVHSAGAAADARAARAAVRGRTRWKVHLTRDIPLPDTLSWRSRHSSPRRYTVQRLCYLSKGISPSKGIGHSSGDLERRPGMAR